MRQANDARKIHRRMCRAYDFIGSNTDNFGFAHENQNNSFLYAADGQWFVIAIKEQDFAREGVGLGPGEFGTFGFEYSGCYIVIDIGDVMPVARRSVRMSLWDRIEFTEDVLLLLRVQRLAKPQIVNYI